MNWNNETIREMERYSIREFMARHRELLKGAVLDFGCGVEGTCKNPQPYRDLVDGQYFPFDHGMEEPAQVEQFDAVMVNQVMQYMVDPVGAILKFRCWLKPGGYLVMTYPTSWDEVEDTDLWRFTKAGMQMMLSVSGFTVLAHERRAEVALGGFRFPLGYGVVATR